MLYPSGGFVDWCGDAELADLDSDGDLDLVHSSFGGAWAGNVPTRIFLNDGAGFFAEFNPSGFQLGSTGIAGGSPALWCQGLQQSGTLDVTGAFADIAEDVDDFELADADGDFDVDVVLVGRSAEVPRFFRNRLELGALAFRDESSLAFPGVAIPGWAYDQELADLDTDGDLDLLGMSWGNVGFFPFATVLENSGGVFAAAPALPLSNFEENGDVLDYDADGDLDLFLAGTGVAGQLFENQGGSPIAFAAVSAAELPALSIASGFDADSADVDADGDADVFVHGLLAAGPAGQGSLLENATGVRDSTPPAIPGLEAITPTAAAAGALPVRARVLDNASLDLVASYPADLLIEVDGAALPPRPMSSARGAIFRGTLPANLVGAVTYRVRAVDGAANAGFSAGVSYAATGSTGASYGLGAGASGGPPPALRALCEPHAGSPLYLLGDGLAGAPLFLGLSLAPFGPFPVPGLPELILNIDPGAPLILVAQAASDAAGRCVFAFELPPGSAGVGLYAQLLELAPSLAFGSSQGLQLPIQ
jgi:hypothetical protein